MNPDIQPVNTSPRVVAETQPVFLTQEASPANRPSDDDIQKTLDTLEKETEKTYVYNNSKLFRRKIEKQSSLQSSDPDASNRSSDGEGDNSESSSNTYFVDDSTEDALQNIREWVWRNDPTLHKELLASDELGTVPLLLDLCNQLCDKTMKLNQNDAIGSHQPGVILDMESTTDQNAKALDQVVKILMDATHEGRVQQTPYTVSGLGTSNFILPPSP